MTEIHPQVARARALHPLLKQEGDEVNQRRELTPPIVTVAVTLPPTASGDLRRTRRRWLLLIVAGVVALKAAAPTEYSAEASPLIEIGAGPLRPVISRMPSL